MYGCGVGAEARVLSPAQGSTVQTEELVSRGDEVSTKGYVSMLQRINLIINFWYIHTFPIRLMPKATQDSQVRT